MGTVTRLRESEREFESWVTGLMDAYKWLWYHPYDSRRSNEGFPDLTAVRGAELIFAELKAETGVPSRDQISWLSALQILERRAERGERTPMGVRSIRPVRAFLWRPSDRPEIERVLR